MKTLSNQQIEENRMTVINLLNQVTIPNANIVGLIDYLNNTDYFYAPASTAYHNNFEGGLCQHSLNVYYNLVKLTKATYEEGLIPLYEPSTLIIVALLHDLSKVNFYEQTVINKKVYSEEGTKFDNIGKFDWVSENAYKVKDVSERFVGGEHGENSVYLIEQFLPLTFEELLAVRHHHFGIGEAKQVNDLSCVANKYPLITLLHMADFMATYINERI